MTWTSLYLVCFLLGFSLSAISWLLGALHLHVHLPHALHGGTPHAHGHGDYYKPGTESLLNLARIITGQNSSVTRTGDS